MILTDLKQKKSILIKIKKKNSKRLESLRK